MKKVLIIAGGYSKEREISILTAKSVFKELKKNNKYKKSDFTQVKQLELVLLLLLDPQQL